MVERLPPAVQDLIAQLDVVIEQRAELDTALLERRINQPDSNILFYHTSYLLGRLQDIKVILSRLGEQRMKLTELNRREASLLPRIRPAVRYSKRVQQIGARVHELTVKMQLDFESLYIFTNMALDQWSHVVAYSLGLPSPEKYRFHQLVMQLQGRNTPDALRSFKDRHLRDALWLYYHVRFYRNKFIEHVDRPLQQGSAMAVEGEDFNLFVPAPSGQLSTSEVEGIARMLAKFAPDWLKQMPPDYWEWRPARLVEVVFNRIDEIDDQRDREEIWGARLTMGGSTVSYLELTRRFTRFMTESMATVREELASTGQAIS